MSAASIKARLLEVEKDRDAILSSEAGNLAPVADLVPEIARMKPKELLLHLFEWESEAPDALNMLLHAASRSEETAVPVARALVRMLTTWKEGQGPWTGVDDVLVRAFPHLTGPERDWVAERSAVREHYGLVPGKDFVAMGEPSEKDQWPRKKPLPPLDDVRGVQARLLRAGYNCGPITGQMNDATRRALTRLQVESSLPATGEIDAETRERLSYEE
jgi:hypothetical protein